MNVWQDREAGHYGSEQPRAHFAMKFSLDIAAAFGDNHRRMPSEVTSLAIENAPVSDGRAQTTGPGPAVGNDDSIQYPGGKGAAGVHQLIINHIPPHKLFVEPFLGAGNIMFRKRSAIRDIGVDVNSDTISTALRRFKDRPSCQLLVAEGIDVLETLSLKLATSAVATNFSDTAVPSIPTTMAMVASSGDSFRNFRNVTANLMAVDRVRAPAAIFDGAITSSDLTAVDVVVYCDPPYLMSTRQSKRRVYAIEPSIDSGAGEQGDEAWHTRLLNVIDSLPCYVLLSGYWSELYEAWLRPPKWRHISYKVRTRGGSTVDEYLWCNFPEPMELHDYRYLGANRRERERIKRKKERWANNLLRMPTLERYAVLAAIREASDISQR